MKTMNINTITFIIVIVLSVWYSNFERCSATRGWRTLKASSSTFNVLDFGAKGDGHTDDTKVILYSFIVYVYFYKCSLV